MSFKFSLATVLRVRALREEREERMLQQIMFEVSQTSRKIEQVEEALSRLNDTRHMTLSMVVHGNDVHASYGELAGLKQHKSELVNHLAKLEELRLRQVKILDSARRDREMLSEMKDQQRSAYNRDVAKREQKMLDDNFASRRDL